MLELQHPAWLLLLLLLPLVAARPWLRGGRAAMRWSSLAVLSGGGGPRVLVSWLPDALQLLGLAALVVALARPQLTHRETVVQSDGIDIMLALDVSGSMDATDFTVDGREATRLDVAKVVVGEFIERRPYDRLGLVVFGMEAFTQAPLTLDHVGLSRFLDQVRIGMAGRDRTAIGQAIGVASARLADLEAPSKVVILLTDGRNNAGRLDPDKAAQMAAALGIKVYTIGVGAHEGRALGGFRFRRGSTGGEIDEVTLRAIAQATGAEYFRATDTDELREIYARIDTLEKSTAEVTEYVQREERFRVALLPGLALLLLARVLGETLLRRLP